MNMRIVHNIFFFFALNPTFDVIRKKIEKKERFKIKID